MIVSNRLYNLHFIILCIKSVCKHLVTREFLMSLLFKLHSDTERCTWNVESGPSSEQFYVLLYILYMCYSVGPQAAEKVHSPISEGDLMLESLNGFFIIISATNEIVFVSENIEQHMGLSQVRL